MRYSAVSLVFVPLGQLLVLMLHGLFGVNESVAVFVAAAFLTPPNYFANKNYVWRHKARDNMRTEIVVFWVAAILGTAFAMGLVYFAGKWFPESDVASKQGAHLAAIFVAQLCGFGIVWVARFVFLDKLLFKVTHHGEEPIATAT